MTIRDMLIEIAPPFLRGPNGVRFLSALAYPIDALDELLRQGVKARFPGVYTMESLPLIGRDRQLDRGPTEPDATYADALAYAFDTHQHDASARGILRQVERYFIPAGRLITLVNSNGLTAVWHLLDGLDEFGRVVADPTNWNWDGLHRWWHGFAILDSSAGPWVRSPTWGSSTWGAWPGTLGSSATRTEVASIRRRVGRKPANVYVPSIVVAMEPGMFSVSAPPGAPGMPDGTWGTHSKIVGGHRVRARNPDALYWQGLE
jgi:hypothetical protein